MFKGLQFRWREPTLPSVPAEAAPLQLTTFFPLYAVNAVGVVPHAEFVSRNYSPPISLGAHMVWPDTAILDPFGGNIVGTIEPTPLYEPQR